MDIFFSRHRTKLHANEHAITMTHSTTSNRLEALRHLISSFPARLEGYWWNSRDICAFLEHGGVDGIDEKLVQHALHSVAKVEGLVETRFYKHVVYYAFGKNPKSSTPQSQEKAASADLFYLPKMVRNFYTGHRHAEFEASIQVIAGKEQDYPEPSTAREETTTTIDLTSTAGAATVVRASDYHTRRRRHRRATACYASIVEFTSRL